MHRRLPLIAAVAASALLGGAGSAAAATISYEATIDVDWSYEITKHEGFDRPDHHSSRDESGAYTGHVTSVNPFVQFVDGKLLPYRAGNGGFTATTKGSSTTVIKDDWSGDSTITCVADGSKPYAKGRSSLSPLVGGIGVRIFDELEVAQSCGGAAAAGSFGLHNEGVESDEDDYVGPFDAVADWSPDTIGPPPGAGKVIQRVKSAVSDAEHCPGEDDSGTITRCRFAYEGTITYLRQDLAHGEEPQPAPTTPTTPTPPAPPTNAAGEQAMIDAVSQAVQEHLHPAAPPAPPAPPAPASTGNPLVDAASTAMQQYLNEARTSVDPSRAQVDVTCPGACTGTLSAEAVARQNAANGTPLGSVVFRDLASTRAAAAGAAPHRMRATLRFSEADRRALGRRRFVRLKLAVRPAGAARATVVRKVVRAPKR